MCLSTDVYQGAQKLYNLQKVYNKLGGSNQVYKIGQKMLGEVAAVVTGSNSQCDLDISALGTLH